MPNYHRLAARGAAAALMAGTSLATAYAQPAADPALMDVITITESRRSPAESDLLKPQTAARPDADAAGLFTRLPGGALTSNGPLSGQVQYRGMFGKRLAIRVDGQSFQSGGPNLMDPPLHYAPTVLLERIEVDRGVSPVRSGPGLAGGANAVFKRVPFTESDTPQFHYDLTGSYRSVNDGVAAGGIAGAATERWRFNLLGALEDGGNTEFPDGEIAASQHERLVYGLGGGVRFGEHELGLDLRRQETGPTGNPPLPMDINYMNTDFARLTYRGTAGALRLDAAVGYTDVDHAMNNFGLRPPPASPIMYREAQAGAETLTAEAALGFDGLGGRWRFGADLEDVAADSTIINPENAAFHVDNLPDVEMTRYGVFTEYSGAFAGLEGELGLRIDRHEADAGVATVGAALPMGPRMLADAFNAADRRRNDTTVDAVAKLWTDLDDAVTLRLTLARKERVPGHLERYAWLPVPVSGGMADGNTYVGDMDLAPETAWIAEAGVDWRVGGAYLRPTVFYRRVNDYIQGVPFDDTPGVVDSMVEMVSAMNGDMTPLKWANVDAELYGADLDFGTPVAGNLRLDGVASIARGTRRDGTDDLYRITPPTLTLAASYQARIWSLSAETVLAAEQNRVSATNSESPSDGYAVFNLYGEWRLREGVSLSGGVENVFDERYSDHLAGVNRVAGSDVAMGARLPAAGRGVYMRLRLTT